MQTESFEGPFDLLLHLILKDDVDLYEIRLYEIVDAYLAELERMDSCDLNISTEFLLIASTLIELKCRRLLPNKNDADLDEELGLWEERDILLARLLECKTFKDASAVLIDLFQKASLSVPRVGQLEDAYIDLSPDPLQGMTAVKLRRAFLRVASEKPVPEISLHHVAAIKVTVREVMEKFVFELPGAGVKNFSSFISEKMDRIEVVVHFLAVLELFKQGMVELDQRECFGDLKISWISETAASSDPYAVDAYDG